MRSFFILLWLIATALCAAADVEHGSRGPPASADYVIVGGGTAGCVLAARLCEAMPHKTITLLERGAPRTLAADTLVQQIRQAGETWLDPALTEAFDSAPNPGLNGRTVDILTGATLGGSSSINAGQWSTPSLKEVAAWGFTGLTVSALKEHYAAAVARVGPGVPPEALQQSYTPLWVDGAAAVGIPTDVDPLALFPIKPEFAAYNPVSADSAGRRRDSYTAYLEPMLRGACSENLEVIQAAVVTRVVIEDGRAVGVAYLKTDEPEGQQAREIAAAEEVVSSAGPYGSPKLLQLSGIGPAALLRSLNISLVQDLPVGQAVQGRVVGSTIDLYTAVPLAPSANSTVLSSAAAAATFAAGDGGPLGVAISALIGTLPAERCLIAGTTAIGATNLDSPTFAVIGIPATASRGTLTITPAAVADPTAPPSVSLNLLSGADEAATLAACLTRLDEATDVIRPELGMFSILPGIPTINETHVRTTSSNSYHFASGCPVGEVVDGDFRVRGVKGLRVVDVSVIPQLPSTSGLMATVYALSEHAAQLIAADEAACRGFVSPQVSRLCHAAWHGRPARRTRRSSSHSSMGNTTAAASASGSTTFTSATTDVTE
eukprot:jgi/Ulvmu1/1752/UM117_0029.1